jgi:HK97 family phage portal protein
VLRGLMRRIFGAALPAPSTGPERRQLVLDTPMQAFYQGAYFAGAPYWAENIAAVTSAVTIISRTIASLPARVYQETDRGRVERPDHPVQRLIARPDGGGGIMSWPDFAEWWVSQALTLGNGLAAIDDDGRGAPVRLRPVPFWLSNPLVNPNSGEVTFHVSATNLPWWPSFSPQTFASSDTLWLRDRTDSGILGRSALSRAPQVLQLATDAQSFASYTFAQGAKLSGALKHPGRLGKEASDNLSASWRQSQAGPTNSGRILVLEEGMEFTAMAMTLEDAELMSSRKFNTEEIARLFNIPLPILNIWDHSTFTNSDTASQWFGQLTLAPWCRKIEAEFGRVLFNDPSFHLEIDLSALMRGSFATRIQSELAMVRAGVLTPNEVRLAEGWPALPGGDKLQPQAVGGRPADTADGAGDTLSAPGTPGRLNGSMPLGNA